MFPVNDIVSSLIAVQMSGGSSEGNNYAGIFEKMPTIWGTPIYGDGWYVLLKYDTETVHVDCPYYYYTFVNTTIDGSVIQIAGECNWINSIYGAVYYRGDFIYACRLTTMPFGVCHRRRYDGYNDNEICDFYTYEYYLVSCGFSNGAVNLQNWNFTITGKLKCSVREISRYTNEADRGDIAYDTTNENTYDFSNPLSTGNYQNIYRSGELFSDISDAWEMGNKLAEFRNVLYG